MNAVSIVIWIIIGASAGWLASTVIKGSAQPRLLRDIVVGIIGACIFGLILRLLGGDDTFTGLSLANILTAFMGAMMVLVVVKLLR
ncbi:MAG: GlsB/YeaQ/YmgE family stress response membrane protein [Chloroflexota bacterium]